MKKYILWIFLGFVAFGGGKYTWSEIALPMATENSQLFSIKAKGAKGKQLMACYPHNSAQRNA